ncbi:UNVERIFIED_CONTAM: hypothetical protein PYX00_005880 [Menopon gallinae]|uniref:Mitochondrial import inner membrane translocase subunit n=1 Tax=Menopon gallinae TaxID=328185 RepID=A0AAW2HT85_9NEOP
MYFDDTSSSLDTTSKDAENQELKEAFIRAKQGAMFAVQVQEYNNYCWDMCVEKIGSKLDRNTESCISNCVERFLDTKIFIANRLAQNFQKSRLHA